MPTDTAGDVGQVYHTNQVHYLAKSIAYTDGASAVVTVGVLPPRAVVIRGGVVVTTAFNAGSGNVLDIGTSGDDDGFATDLALGTIGVISADEMATTNDAYSTSAVTITATLALTGTAASAGAGVVWLEYVMADR
jgi:hypothetical protein